MISDGAKKIINLCCEMHSQDQRSDWPNWSNSSFVGLYKVFCNGVLNDKVGSGQTTTSAPQLQAKLEAILTQFPLKLSQADLGAGTSAAGKDAKAKAFGFIM